MNKASHAPAGLGGYLHPATLEWFSQVFDGPTAAQRLAWPEIAAGRSTLLLAPTGSGKTLAAFLISIDRLIFGAADPSSGTPHLQANEARPATRVLYISPLKALGVDVERNLKAPLAGIRAVVERQGMPCRWPTIAIRSGDTPAAERSQLVRTPPDILITTPESLFLLLTSKAREILRDVQTVIVDEIHSVVATKRGTHLFASLERLERLRREHDPERRAIQRIGLSATLRPLDEVARLLGGAEATGDPNERPRPRDVAVVEAGRRKKLDLKVEVPVEDMTRLDQTSFVSGPTSGPSLPSIWPSIHPRLVDLIRAHRSTMIFVNSRRLAERLAASINEIAEEEIALAHHGSIARDIRLQIENRLKRGQLPAIVATSSLELGIDMGAVDLVIQIEAPPSIASGLQRVGRAGHQVDGQSKGIVFPKYRGDLLACSAAAARMLTGDVEETFYPRNPLDVLAQQVVAMVALGPQKVDDLYATMRSASPFLELSRSAFESVLDLLAGRYPSDEFAGLRPRLTWDRIDGVVLPRKGTQRLAILNAGTIPDRGLYGVFLADNSQERGGDADGGSNARRGGKRVGELDEEMVYETRPGDVFLLGASSWRVMDITRDRVLVTPAPGEPGKMPFWRGDGIGRPLEFGRAIGNLARRFQRLPRTQGEQELTGKHALDAQAAKNLLNYLQDQAAATKVVPSDKNIVVESFVDEIGDWRVAILSPFGARVHAPWAMAVLTRLNREGARDVDMMWTDDGMMFRLPESDHPPKLEMFFPRSEEIEQQVVDQLGATALFAARFRENAARALLLPKRQPGRRTPLWLQRRRSADLLSVASRFPSFPILLETYRECLRDVFDLRGLKNLLREVESRRIRIQQVETSVASPFASSLMFNYVGNFLYDGDAPLAERRAATLTLDQTQLRDLLGDAELRELIDGQAVEELTLELQRLDGKYPIGSPDAIHDLLLYLGDLSREEIALRCDEKALPEAWIDELVTDRRAVETMIAGQARYIAAEDVSRFRDALGTVSPMGLPDEFLESVQDPVADLVSRFARTHGPFQAEDVRHRLGLPVGAIHAALERLIGRGRIVKGEFLPGGRGHEYCESEALKKLKRRSLARLRKQIAPVEPGSMARFLVRWQGLDRPRDGLDGLLDVIEQLQGVALPASDLERYILPARISGYQPAALDELCAAGEVVWQGVESIGGEDGRIALYLTDHLTKLMRMPARLEGEMMDRIRALLAERGALFFGDVEQTLGVFPNDVLEAIWDLVWNGEVTNDTLVPLRSLNGRGEHRRQDRRRHAHRFRSRRAAQVPGSEGRWSLVQVSTGEPPSSTERQAAFASQLLERYGVVTRELVAGESLAGGFSGFYPVFRAMEETGHVRRGYFVDGQGAAQFAKPGAEDLLRESPSDGPPEERNGVLILAANDPANPYGTALKWPRSQQDTKVRPTRSVGARVMIIGGELAAHLNRNQSQLITFLPKDEPDRTKVAGLLANALASLATEKSAVFLEKIDGVPADQAEYAKTLESFGFAITSRGVLHRRLRA